MKKTTEQNSPLAHYKKLYKKHLSLVPECLENANSLASLNEESFKNEIIEKVSTQYIDLQSLNICLCQMAKHLAKSKKLFTSANYNTEIHLVIYEFIQFFKNFKPENNTEEIMVMTERLYLFSEIFSSFNNSNVDKNLRLLIENFKSSISHDISIYRKDNSTIIAPLSDLIRAWDTVLEIIEGNIDIKINTKDSKLKVSFIQARIHLKNINSLIQEAKQVVDAIKESREISLVCSEQLRQDIRALIEVITCECRAAYLGFKDITFNNVNQLELLCLRIQNRRDGDSPFEFNRLIRILVDTMPACTRRVKAFIGNDKERYKYLLSVATKENWPRDRAFLHTAQNPLDAESLKWFNDTMRGKESLQKPKASENAESCHDESDDGNSLEQNYSLKNKILNELLDKVENRRMTKTIAKKYSTFTDSEYFSHIYKGVFKRLDNEIKRLDKYKALNYNADKKILLKLKERMISMISKKLISLDSSLDIVYEINKDLKKLVKHTIDKNPSLRTPNNPTLHVLREILLVLFAAVCLFIPLLSKTYREFTFQTPTVFQLSQVNRELNKH